MKVTNIENISPERTRKYQQWQWSREVLDGCPNFMFAVSASMTSQNMARHFPEITLIIVYLKGDQLNYCHPEHELEEVVQKIIDKSKKNLDYTDRIYQEWTDSRLNLRKLYSQVNSQDISKLTDEELLDLYDKVTVDTKETLGLAFFIDAFPVCEDKIAENNFRDFLAAKGLEGKFSQYYGMLTKTEEPTFQNRFENELRVLADGSDKSKMDEILQKFAWLRSTYINFDPIDEEYIKEELGHLKDEKSADIVAQKEKLKKELGVPAEIDNQLALMTRLSSWQDQRKEICLRSFEVGANILDEVSRRLEIDKSVLSWICPPEFRDLFAGKLDLGQIKKRRKNCLYIQQGDDFEVLTEKAAAELFGQLFPTNNSSDIKELSGMAASPGKVTGKAKILLSSRQESKMNKGDILVAGMTRPDYMPALRKAGAIVTDEGGITCHAAIVARELGIPCIVGTKRATSTLKDGDKIEVDADQGIVKIVE